MRSVFVAADGRLRAPWRILLFVVVWIIASAIVMRVLAPALVAAQRLTQVDGTAVSLGMVASLLIAHAAMLHLDRRSFAYVALQKEAARAPVMVAGFAIGAAPIALTSLILIAIGWLAVVPSVPGSWTVAALQVSLGLLPAALYEELMSRGYIFAALREWLGPVAAIAVTSTGFGLLHLWNPGANGFSITTVIVAGVFLATVLVVTGSLYATWMAHWAWNWVMAVPLHVAVSGLPLARPDYQTVDAGPDWATGGRWGPEGGAGAAAAMIGGLVFLYLRRSRLSVLGSRPATTEPLGTPAESREQTAENRGSAEGRPEVGGR